MLAAARLDAMIVFVVLAAVLAASPEAATRAWIQGIVVGQDLCPWARRARARIVCPRDPAALLAMVPSEAAALEASSAPFATTLLVLPGRSKDAYDVGAYDFGAIFGQAAASVSGGTIKLLAFHPERLDGGPGCSSDPDDAAHFSVRSPLPTVQLLRERDLSHARAEWESWEAKQPASAGRRYPGAFGLLLRNKRRLRDVGSLQLRRLLDACRT